MVPLLRPIIEGALRLFGTAPSTLYARLELVTRTSLRELILELCGKSGTVSPPRLVDGDSAARFDISWS